MKKDSIPLEAFDLGLNPIKSSSNTFFKKVLFTKKQKHRVYSKSKVAFGTKENGSIFYLDTREAFRMLIVGQTRTGKSFTVRGLGDRLLRSGYAVVYLPDVKNEFKSSVKPLQKKFEKGILENEHPTGTNVMTFRPTFFKNVRGYNTLPEDNYWYTANLKDLSELDFMTMINADELTEPQRIAVKEIYEQIIKVEGVVDLNIVNDIIENLEDFDERQKMSLRTKFLPLKYSYILEDDEIKGLEFKDMINAGVVLALNMEGFDNISRDGAGLPQVYVSIWLRKLIELRRRRLITSIFIITDEASRFIPAQGDPSCKIEFLESIDIDTRYGINYIFATQSPTKVPENLINQCRYLLIPYNAEVETFKYLFKLSGVVTWSLNVYTQRCAQLKKSMKKYQWVIIDRNTNSYDIITSLSPLSYHEETTK